MSSQPLQGKKVLFFSWPFYQYPEKIKNKLIELGGDVTYYSSASTNNFLKLRFLEHFEDLRKSYFKRILDEVSKKQFDYVFMINAAIFPEYFLKDLNRICEKSCKLLYSWDSIAVYPAAKKLHKYFDYIYSFDSEDTKNHDYIKFLPLFYCDDMFDGRKENTFKYDFSFIGFGHTDRYHFIQAIKKFANENNYSYFFKLYLPSKIHFIRGKYFKGIFKDAQINEFVYKPVPLEITKEITLNSKIVVDIELSNQSGLTMRTIETHGMRKKLITTNKNIREYDFYNENNICIVDRQNPVPTKSFVESDYIPLLDNLYEKYTLSHWLKVIFRCEYED